MNVVLALCASAVMGTGRADAQVLQIVDAAVSEGDPGSSTQVVFTVALTYLDPPAGPVSVHYATQPGTADADVDYTSTSGTLSFPAGTHLAAISVAVLPDLLPEANETFSVVLSSPTNATIGWGTGVGTIVDDDTALSLYTVTPCRFIDSRTVQPFLANIPLTVGLTDFCGIPTTARAVILNIAAVSPTHAGHIRLYPGETPPTVTSAVSFASGQTRSNSVIATLGANGSVTIDCRMPTGSTHVVLDVFGYFE